VLPPLLSHPAGSIFSLHASSRRYALLALGNYAAHADAHVALTEVPFIPSSLLFSFCFLLPFRLVAAAFCLFSFPRAPPAVHPVLLVILRPSSAAFLGLLCCHRVRYLPPPYFVQADVVKSGL